MFDKIIIIIMMTLVTYIPRVLPFTLFKDRNIAPYWISFLKLIPYAALASLIFPQVIYSTGSIGSAIFGAALAVLLASTKINVIYVVIVGITGSFIFDIINIHFFN